MSDTSDLGNSQYEFVTTADGDSQEDTMTESIASLDASRPEDVRSVGDSDHSYDSDADAEDDSDHEDSSDVQSLQYTTQALGNPSSLHLPNSWQYGSSIETLMPPIEFKEADGESKIRQGYVAVRHTIRGLEEAEAAEVARTMNMAEPPKHLIATIRQTMALEYLSTAEPLRVLYTGSPQGETDIVKKLSTAICARDAALDTEGIYHICQISNFLSAQEPEVELLASSPYQIKIEHCKCAEVTENPLTEDKTYTITLDKNRTYTSGVTTGSGYAIEPRWQLPHIAVFYCTETDDEAAEDTRAATWEFMTRHGVPSIFVSHSQSFTSAFSGRWRQFIGPHEVHLCLESRDPERQMAQQRFPIDLVSFMNIDARQMNRNLSFLTGLSEKPSQEQSTGGVLSRRLLNTDVLKARLPKSLASVVPSQAQCTRWIERLGGPMAALTMTTGILALLTSLLITLFSGLGASDLPNRALTTSSPALLTTAPVIATATSTSTVVVGITETRTVRIAEPTTSALGAVLSYAGLLSDKPSVAPPVDGDAKSTSCTAEVYSSNEILVRLPPSRKTMWLAKGAIDIDVSRGQESLKYKLSSIDEGILVELGKKDAHGVLNVSVVTTRRPKINETFEVNLGRAPLTEVLGAGVRSLQGMLDQAVEESGCAARKVGHAVASLQGDAAAMLDNIVQTGGSTAKDFAGQVGSTAKNFAGQVGSTAKELTGQVGETVDRVKGSLSSQRENVAKVASQAQDQIRHAQEHVGHQLAVVQRLWDDRSMYLVQAQIASRLGWLKVQGKSAEWAEYKRNATKLLRKIRQEQAAAHKRQLEKQSGKDCGESWGWLKCSRRETGTAPEYQHRDGLWGMIRGRA